MAEKKETDVFFVGIKDPIEIRRSILESLKGTVEDLQRFERFKAVREEKANTAAALKGQVKEIQKLINKLKSELPKGDLRIKLGLEHAAVEEEKAKKEAAKKDKKKKKAKKVVKKEVKVKPKELSELEKLESELSNIESALGKIS